MVAWPIHHHSRVVESILELEDSSCHDSKRIFSQLCRKCGIGSYGVGNYSGENPGLGIEGRMFEGVCDSENAGDITSGDRNTPDSFISMILEYLLFNS